MLLAGSGEMADAVKLEVKPDGQPQTTTAYLAPAFAQGFRSVVRWID